MSRAALGGGLAGCLLVLLLAAGGVQAQAAPASTGTHAADDQEARDLFKLGKQAFDEGRYERALKYFKDAYDLSHRAALLSNIGTVLDRLRRDAEALETYKSYLAQVPDAPNRGLIEERVRVIESAMQKAEQQPSAAPGSEPQPAVPSPAETAQAEMERTATASSASTPPLEAEPAAESKSITSRWWFWASIGTVAAAAVVVGVAANSGGGGTMVQAPAVTDAATRVREL
jgi:tetratricopeptide (TPR) repeat protein